MGRSPRIEWTLLSLHVALIVFATIALTTFLAGAPPAWMQTGANAVVAYWGWKLSGPTYVTLGALAALVHASGRLDSRRAFMLLAAGTLASLTAELIGTSTGLPFGPYSYTTMLGYRIGGLVPFPIPLSWFYMIYCSLAICGRFLPAADDWRSKLTWAAIGGLVLTAWDVSMDPAMSFATKHWIWHVAGSFYGMPWLNWFGWWLTGTIIARLYLEVVPPTVYAARVSPSPFTLVLYAINGVMPIAICARHGLTWAAVLGALAMGIPLLLASTANPVRRVVPNTSRLGSREPASG
ncbi:MAG: carotenoid biosynthesis protein [Gemmatimonadota bacterium]